MKRPVRIHYYGMFWMTKRTYLTITIVLGLIAVAFLLFVVMKAGDRLPPFTMPWDPAPPNLMPGWQGWF